MTDQDNEQQLIDDGIAARLFLESDAGKRIKERMGRTTYNEWRLAKTTQEREAAWARSEAFNKLFDEMESTKEKGENAQAIRTRREKVAAQKT